MNKKKRLLLLLLLMGICFVVYSIMDYYHLFPHNVGVIIVNDGASVTTAPADNQKDSQGLPTIMPEADNLGAEAEVEDATDLKEAMTTLQEDTMFYYENISQEIKDRITGISYGEDCEVPYEDLRYVKVLYWGFDEESHTGELIVNKAIAEDILEIFKELYEAQYPIEKMVLVDEYDADDNASMADNNSSAFNYRVIDGTNRLSIHSYGLAIDINPLYNPYVREIDGKTIITPVNGTQYADRTLDCSYYIKKDDLCYQAFIERGFTWGGEWKSSKDYQHFQKKID